MDFKYKLSENDHESVYTRLEAEMLIESQPSNTPIVVIIGGQPGCGKSMLIDMAKQVITAPAIINGDDYRMAHPQAAQIFADDDKLFAERTDPDVRDWTKRLFDKAIETRRNIIFEGTMRNAGPIMGTIENLKKQGYRVEVMVMAVNGQLSKLSTVERYETQKAKRGYARWTLPESHDEAYKNMPETVAAIEKNSPIDSIKVYNRPGELLYHNERINGRFEASPGNDAKAAVEKERSRTFTPEEKVKYAQASDEILKNMES